MWVKETSKSRTVHQNSSGIDQNRTSELTRMLIQKGECAEKPCLHKKQHSDPKCTTHYWVSSPALSLHCIQECSSSHKNNVIVKFSSNIAILDLMHMDASPQCNFSEISNSVQWLFKGTLIKNFTIEVMK